MIKYMVIDVMLDPSLSDGAYIDIVSQDIPDIQMAEAARSAYLKNYEDGSDGLADNVKIVQYRE